MAGDNEVLVKVNGDSSGGVSAVRQMNDELNRLGTGSQGLQFNLQSLGRSIFDNLGTFGAFALTANSVLGVIGELGSAVGNVVGTFVSLGETIANVVVGALQAAGQEIENLTEQVFELNKSTEQNVGSWRYIYGAQQSHDLMQWSSQFSFNVPYTRQDLMGAITALGRAGFGENDVQNYMSDIADMSALNPQRTLTQAAWAIQGMEHGYSRMLKYDYGIDASDLEEFGYDPNDPGNTLMPALHGYLQARHLLGAAKYAATQTFWGAESSFVDRLQNLGLMVGGTDLAGNVAPGSMFGGMKSALTDLSKWWDDHQSDINKFAHIIGDVLGGAFKMARAGVEGLATGLHASGIDSLIEHVLTGLGQWLNNPGTQAGLEKFGQVFGNLAGALASQAWEAAANFFDALGKTGLPQQLFDSLIGLFTNISNFFFWHGAEINEFFRNLGTMTGDGAHAVGDAFRQIGQSFQDLRNAMTQQEWDDLKWLFSPEASGGLKLLEISFSGFVGSLKLLVDQLAHALDILNKLNDATHGGLFGAGGAGAGGSDGGTSGGGGGGGGGVLKKYAVTASSSSNSTINLYGANTAQVTAVTQKMLDDRDRGSYLAKRTPGGFASGGILF